MNRLYPLMLHVSFSISKGRNDLWDISLHVISMVDFSDLCVVFLMCFVCDVLHSHWVSFVMCCFYASHVVFFKK